MQEKDIRCPSCGSERTRRNGKGRIVDKNSFDRKCIECNRRFTVFDVEFNDEWYKKVFAKNLESKVVKEIEGDNGSIESNSTDIKTLDELIEFCKIDLSVWDIEKHIVNKYGVNFQVKAWMEKKVLGKKTIEIIHPVLFTLPLVPSIKIPQSKIKKTIILADMQIGFNRDINTGSLEPFHDRSAINCALDIIRDEQPEEIILNGDNLDLTEASKFEKKPEYFFTLQPAINEMGWLLSVLRTISPNSKIVWISGNHENRIEKSITNNLVYAYGIKPYNCDIPVMSLYNLLGMEKLDITYIPRYPSGTYWINNDLKVIHGEFIKLNKELEITKVSTIMSHVHKIEQTARTTTGRNGSSNVFIVSTGCLCKIDGTVPGVNSRPNWQNGITYVESTENKFNIQNVQIINGETLFKSKEYKGKDYEEVIKDIIYQKK